jgi:hypothetical protein
LTVFLVMFKKLENKMLEFDSSLGRIPTDDDPLD